MPAFSLALAALLMPSLAQAQSSIEDFQLGGSAKPLGEDCIRLTPDQPYLTGSAWFEEPVDLTQAFEMKMSLVLGKKDFDGADGIVFVFHPSMTTGFRGEGMGFAGLRPSLGIEFDTYQNYHLNDPFDDHLAIMTNGELFHAEGSTKELPNLEDGVRHKLRISWSPTSGMTIHLDDTLRGSISATRVKAVFGGNTKVFWGMTAGTGRLFNNQDVCIESMLLGARVRPRPEREI
ncbi:MAG: L-type lectin-domain containing protein [Myxococcota bacterium]